MKAAICLVISLFALSATAQDLPERDAWRTDTIEIQGLDRTEPFVVERELLFRAGAIVTRKQLEESVQRLRNLGLFRIAQYTLIPMDPRGINVRVVITVDERWTLMPFFNISFGGDLFSLLTGIYDVNTFGRFLEAGFRYQRLGTTNSYVVWFRDPRFLNQRMSIATELWWTNRLRYLYDNDGNAQSGYLRERQTLRIAFAKELSKFLTLGTGLTLLNDTYRLDLVPDDLAQAQVSLGLPKAQFITALNVNATVGRIDDDSYLRDGVELAQGFSVSTTALGSSENFVESGTQLLAFKKLPWKQNIGLRWGVGMTSADHPENQFFLGGLDTVRGFYDSRFTGAFYWYLNSEYRIPSIDHPWFTLQHTAFFDAAGVSDRPSNMWDADGASAGIGLRLLSPKIYRFGGRIDYAIPVKGTGTTPLSFGVQQFF